MRILFALLAGALCQGGQTRTWLQTDYADFEKGNIKNLSLRSDGRLVLAPEFQEIFDSSSAYLWALAGDSKGNLYAGGGPGAKLYRIAPGGEKKVIAEWDALEVHAIAIDKSDQVFAATSPDGKIYKIGPQGQPKIFYDPKTKYIWSIAFNSKGELFVATGEHGQIHRVTAEGNGGVFFETGETHARSLTIDQADNLIVGTEPAGLVLRVSPVGRGFVLYQIGKKEVTAVAVSPHGLIYAAGVGNKQQPAPLAPAVVAPLPASLPAPGPAPLSQHVPAPSPPPPLPSGSQFTISGGTDVYCIDVDGSPRKVWVHAQDVVYAIAFDEVGHALLGTGNKGVIYRLDSDPLYTALRDAPATQVTALERGRDGRLYVATGNVGKVYQVGPALAREGSIESDVFDSGMFSLWGRLEFEGAANDGRISFAARSGNLDQPQKNWSPWSGAITSPKGDRIPSPPARFVQWKATLSMERRGRSPELDSVQLAYLPKNVAPRIQQIEITPVNRRFPAPPSGIIPVSALALPPLGKRSKTAAAGVPASESVTPAMQYAKGFLGTRWAASDDNGDSLIYQIAIRGVQELEWKLLKDQIKEKYFSWDSTAFPDGEYRLRVTASDLPSNSKEMALSGTLESETFLIDNSPPRITGLHASRSGAKLRVRWKATDALTNIDKAEYSLDGGDWLLVSPLSQLSDSAELDYDLTIDGVSSGEHTIAVRVQDEYENQATNKAVVKPAT